MSHDDIRATGRRDFVTRERKPTLAQLFLICVIVLIIAVSFVGVLYNKMALISILFILAGYLGWYTTLHVQRNRDQMDATEFMNALLAGALSLERQFCLIVKQEGEVIYFNRAFQEMFPNFLKQDDHSLSALLTLGRVAKTEKESILAAVSQNRQDDAMIAIHDNDRTHAINLTVRPLLRPIGYLLVSGHETN